MGLQILRQLRESTRQMTYGSLLYDWSLRGDIPDRLLVKPVDQWPGRHEAGRWLCEGAFVLEDAQLDIRQARRGTLWEPSGVDAAWLAHMHGFCWLRDLRALGGEDARLQARAMIGSWLDHYPRWSKTAWKPEITGMRLSMWISHYDFFSFQPRSSYYEETEEALSFQDSLFESMVRQARHLVRVLTGGESTVFGVARLQAIKGLLYAGLAFEGHEDWVVRALDALEAEIDIQVLGDGAHISRSPGQLLDVLRIVLDIRTALTAGGYPVPETVQHAIDRMGPALRFFRYNDKLLALFGGSQKGDEDIIDCVLAQAGVRGRGLQSLPCAGYERASLGRTFLMFDCGVTPPYPFDKGAHASPLSFEMCYGRERILVSCGTHPGCADWQDALRATAAHNTLNIDHRNACEIRADGHIARRVRSVSPRREETPDSVLLEGTHDGYRALSGLIHRRRLFLTGQGYDLRGEDTLICDVGLARSHDFAIRFHVHPRVLVSLAKDGQSALLRLPSGVGWRFQNGAGTLALEDSVYLGQGTRARKTKQLVIFGQITEDNTKIKWALQRESL